MENDNVEDDEYKTVCHQPKDRWNFVLFLFTVLGISGLLPWNLFITAHQYFLYKLGEKNQTDSYLQENFENYFIVAGSLSAVIGNVLNVCLAHNLSGDARVILGHVLVFVSLSVTFILAFLDTDSWRLVFFISTLLLLILAQIGCSGFLCGGSAGLAAMYPSKYMTAFIIGQAVCGVFTSVISILSLAVASGLPLDAGRVYFGISILFTISSLLIYYPSRSNNFVKFYKSKKRKLSMNVVDEDFEPLLGGADAIDSRRNDNSNANTRVVLRKTLFNGSLLAFVFIATLSCFPALTSKVVSQSDSQVWQKYFIAVTCFLLVNAFDCLGRLLTTYVLWPSSRSPMLLVVCLIRVGFIFLFLLCNFSSKNYFPTVFFSDWWFAVFASLLGFSNGYLCNLLCLYIPQRLPVEEKETAGTLISAYINFGVFIGSCLSFAVVKLI